MLTVLNIAYPLAPVGPDAVGGAEQILSALDRALVRQGHHSIVVACAGSTVAGDLLPLPPVPAGEIDAQARSTAQSAARAAIATVFDQVDLVHLHGLDFETYLPPPGKPVLVTLHLPLDWYACLRPERPRTWLNCVSTSQQRACPPGLDLLPPVPNGVPVDALAPANHARGDYALQLGRICPEKGQHLALEVAHKAGMPLLLAGRAFPYPAHRAYFETAIRPRLDRRRRHIGPVGFARKRRLLAGARCLLVPSLVAETSSLVAMEALACGTPVIAFRRGALAEIVEPGRTGFLVEDAAEMADAIGRVDRIPSGVCRAAARARFSLDAMIESYFRLYRRLAA